MRVLLFCLICCTYFVSCTKSEEAGIPPKLILRFKFDSTQARLNGVGQPAVMPAGHAAQSPLFNTMSAHYIELSPNNTTALGEGAVIYTAPETTEGGDKAIDFSKAQLAGNNEVFYAINLADVPAGNYEWLRLSLAYQNYSVNYHIDSTVYDTIHVNNDFSGTIASFIGYNTYLGVYTIKTRPDTVNANKAQGYWAFETSITVGSYSETFTSKGQSAAGSTTVVNPLFDSSPIPPGSCVVTAAFLPGKLTITGKETENIVVEVSLSTNKSFEWQELVENGLWDPLKGEPVVDMGIRGMIPTIK